MDWHFQQEIKLYVIENGQVSVGFRLGDTSVWKATFTQEEFQYIIDHWVLGIEGYRTEQAGKIFWSYRDRGPRPECLPMSFVAISIKGFEFRVSVDGMKDAVQQFYNQIDKK